MSRLTSMPGMNLSTLGQLDPPADNFAAIMTATRRARNLARLRKRWLPVSVAAAALLMLAVLTGLVAKIDQREQQMQEWIAYSQELESQLRTVAGNSMAMRGHRAAAVSTLADEVAAIDWALAQQPGADIALGLWQTRASLLNDLVSVHASGHWLNQASNLDQDRYPVVTLNSQLPAPAGPVEI